MKATTPKLETVLIYTDGASRSNPGPAAAAWVVCDESKKVLLEKAIYLGRATNNEAEYRAVIEGLKAGAGFCRRQAIVRLNSELVIKQLAGAYRVKAEHLLEVLQEAHRTALLYRGGVKYRVSDPFHAPDCSGRSALQRVLGRGRLGVGAFTPRVPAPGSALRPASSERAVPTSGSCPVGPNTTGVASPFADPDVISVRLYLRDDRGKGEPAHPVHDPIGLDNVAAWRRRPPARPYHQVDSWYRHR